MLIVGQEICVMRNPKKAEQPMATGEAATITVMSVADNAKKPH